MQIWLTKEKLIEKSFAFDVVESKVFNVSGQMFLQNEKCSAESNQII